MDNRLIFTALLAVIVAWLVYCFNALVKFQNRFKNAFAQIDVQLQRRYSLIPNLVETAKMYMQHERTALEAVVAARQSAQTAGQRVIANPTNADAMRTLISSEAALGGALGRLFAVVEAYPDLKADQTMLRLQEELSSTENRIAFARQAYNDAVMSYNIEREKFPNNLVVNIFGFATAQMWEIKENTVRSEVKVNF